MSAQKRNLAHRLKAAESSNRQLRAELQEVKTGWRWGANPNPIAHQASSPASRPATGVSGKTLAIPFLSVDLRVNTDKSIWQLLWQCML